MSDLRNANSGNRAARQAIWLCLVIPAGLLVGYSLLARVLVRREIPAAEPHSLRPVRRPAPTPSALPMRAAPLPNEWTRRIAAYDRAATAGDRATLLRLLEGSGRFIDVHGDVWDRQGYAARLVREGAKTTQTVSWAQALRVIGTVAIESGTRETVQRTNGRSLRWQSRYTRIWLRNRKGWTLWTEQSTALPFWPRAQQARGEE